MKKISELARKHKSRRHVVASHLNHCEMALSDFGREEATRQPAFYAPAESVEASK